ncbi:hypothetical protein HYP93_gp33 [Stenotrophomonas phage Pokken]|uniref:Uncharacterized protein n=1 Tax=Stenotrophomonas phage Pokken TaxID=2596674 RepID=A0A5B9N9H2_9CAUD|nr:hypothetical protein HYP93_gp33 [Stenotrophomonas phage Pokken]QEG09256.1 hypothetical protein CPT_Pokken_033 [Stenotrophomonas phage Pokken]
MFNRGKMLMAGLLAGLGATAGRRKVDQTPVAKTKGIARHRNPNARYHGGKHTSRALPHIHEAYIVEAQKKRDRKNAKRAIEFGYA